MNLSKKSPGFCPLSYKSGRALLVERKPRVQCDDPCSIADKLPNGYYSVLVVIVVVVVDSSLRFFVSSSSLVITYNWRRRTRHTFERVVMAEW